jgi:hypothetical protein
VRIEENKIFKIQGHVAAIKRQAQDRSGIRDECDAISQILKEVIADGTSNR